MNPATPTAGPALDDESGYPAILDVPARGARKALFDGELVVWQRVDLHQASGISIGQLAVSPTTVRGVSWKAEGHQAEASDVLRSRATWPAASA